jgi:hypothetical protein
MRNQPLAIQIEGNCQHVTAAAGEDGKQNMARQNAKGPEQRSGPFEFNN